jgi:hypothetical protein
VISVDKVQANGGVSNKEFALLGFANVDLLPFENRGWAGFMNTDSVGHSIVNLCEVFVGADDKISVVVGWV